MYFDSIFVELTSVCDMSCEFCPNSTMSRPKKHIDFDLFLNIIDQIVANHLTKHIKLAALGESLLYPKLLEAIKYCTEKNLVTSMFTNSLLLTTDLYQKLVDSGLKGIQISLQDLTEDSFVYRHAKRKISYSSFYQNVIKLIDYHVSHNIPIPMVICIMFSKPQWISSELWDLPAIKESTKYVTVLSQMFVDEMNKIAYKNNVKCYLNKRSFGFSLRALNVFKSRDIKIMDNVFLHMTPLNPELFNTRKKLDGVLGNKIKLVKRTKGSCPSLAEPMILSNGSFIPCCIDCLGESAMGKVTTENSLISIINSEKYQNLIKGFKNHNVINPVCQECKGKLVYKNPFSRLVYLITSFNIYTLIAISIRKWHSLWKLLKK
ncbi:MAG: radical SAM protein [Methanocellales archaeon]|nr:radical SAM protein [Methanocellales archaeon]